MTMYHRYTSSAPYSYPVESSLSSSTVPNPGGAPNHVGRQVGEVELSETTSPSGPVDSSPDFEAIAINDHAPAFTLAPATAPSAGGISSGWTTSRTRPDSSPVVFALGISSTSSTLDSQVASSQRPTETTAVPSSTAHASTGDPIHPSFSSAASESALTQTATASPDSIDSARTTGIILGSVLGGLAVLMIAGLAIIYAVWRRRRRRPGDQADREKQPTKRQSNESQGGQGNTVEERRRSVESPTTLPLQGVTTPRTLRSEPIIVDAISPVTPIMPHLSRWTSEKADLPSPPGHPAIDIPPHLRHHPLFASTLYGDEEEEDDEEDYHHHHIRSHGHARRHQDPQDVSPCSSSSSSPGPPGAAHAPAPSAVTVPPPATGDNAAAAFSGFLFFDENNSPSSRSSTRRPSTRDSSAPRTALSVPPPHRPPPRRRHTRAGGQGRDGGGVSSSAARSRSRLRRESGSSSVSGSDGGGGGLGAASSAGPPSMPPPVPVRSAARSKSLRHSERPGVWI